MSTACAIRGGQRVAVLACLLVVVISACGGSASASPSPTPAPSPTPTQAPSPSPSPTPTALPSPSPSAVAAADPAAGLAIAPPYTLAPLDPALDASFRQQFSATAGAFASLIGVGGKEVVKNGALAGYTFVVGFPPGIMTDATYQTMLTGIATNAQLQFKTTMTSGVAVSTGSNATNGYGVFRVGDHILIVATTPGAASGTIAAALIAANK